MTKLLSASILQDFAISDPLLVAETSLARVWRVRRADGTLAALKIYHTDMDDEAPGFDLLQLWSGHGAALLYERQDTAVLLEWLDGASLGDMVRAGDDTRATGIIADVATRLHQKPLQTPNGFRYLHDEFQALLQARFTPDCPAPIKQGIQRAKALAGQLLDSQTDQRPLHRDLHHDNIKSSERGYLAFDAKGVIGERAFDLANAFRNPIGAEDLYCTPEVILRRADVFAHRFDVDRKRLLAWAQANAALSLAWTADGLFGPDILEKDAAGLRFLEQSAKLGQHR